MNNILFADMGVGKSFPGGGQKCFAGGAAMVKFSFYELETQ